MNTIRIAGYLGSIAITAGLLSACATAKPPEAARAPVAQSAPRLGGHIYVTEDSLDTACYQDLGDVSYAEPFAEAATDPEQLGVADGLRAAAAKKYPNQVDAVINVHVHDSNVGTEVAASGEAVRIEPPSKLDCKLPDKIAAAFVNFATGSRNIDQRRGATFGSGFNGPAGTPDPPQNNSGAERAWQINDNARHKMIESIPGQTEPNGQSLVDQVQLQQAEIKRLRRQIDRIVNGRCEAADVSAVQCASMRKSAELAQPHEVVAVTNKAAGDKGPTFFEIQNLIQAQQELIAKLQHQLVDLNEPVPEVHGADASN